MDAAQLWLMLGAFHLELLDHHAGRVRQLVAGITEYFFAQYFCGQKFFAAISNVVLVVNQFSKRQMAAQGLAQFLQLAAQFCAHRHDVGKLKVFCNTLSKRE